MKIRLLAMISAVLFLALSAPSAPAKEKPPKPGKMKKVSFPSYKEFKTRRGTEVIVVEHHEQPEVTISVIIKAGDVHDPEGRYGLADFTASLLNKGTKSRSAKELAEWIESVGGKVQAVTSSDYSMALVSILSEFKETAYEYLADIIMNPVFPDDEIETYRKRVKTALEMELSDPGSMAQRHFLRVVYGPHPYAKRPTVETVEAITRDDILDFYQRYYLANNAIVAVVGDVKWKDVKKALQRHLGEWRKGDVTPLAYPKPQSPDSTRIYLFHRPGSVQTNLLVGHLGLEAKNKDWPAVTVMNRILGGGADARLFMNLREKRGWTYGAYSRFNRAKDIGYFAARAAVRTEVTDSVLVELMRELERITKEEVDQEELNHAKSYLIGHFPLTIETPDQIAREVIRVKLLGLGKEHLEKYRERIKKVESDDVLEAAAKYLHPDRMCIVLVGDATEIKGKVARVAPVSLFDIEGKPITADELAVAPAHFDFETTDLAPLSAVYSVSVGKMSIGELKVSVSRWTSEAGDKLKISSSLEGMMSVQENMEMAAADLAPVSYQMSVSAGGREAGGSLNFDAGTATGTIMTLGRSDTLKVAQELVEGVILDSAIEFALAALPLEVGASYRFPALDTESGKLINLKVKVEAEEEIEVPAGSFKIYKIKVQSGDDISYMYCRKDSPHLLVKLEVPKQGFGYQLKEFSRE